MEDYEKLLKFRDNSVKDLPICKTEGKRITEESFNLPIMEFLKDDSTVLDYGCGTGWGLFELGFTKNITKGIGIDPSINAIEYANNVAKESKLNNISFVCGDENTLRNLNEKFDFIFCVNTIDVLPDQIINKILSAFYHSIANEGYIFIGINPFFSPSFLTNNLGMQIQDKYCYKNSILRANLKSVDEWRVVFSHYFEVIRTFEFCLTSTEKQFPRRGFILKRK